MRLLIFLTTLLILASCGNNKLRFKRVSPINKQKIVTVSDQANTQDLVQAPSKELNTASVNSAEAETPNYSEEETTDVLQEESSFTHIEEIQTEEIPIAYSDTLDGDENETEEIKAIAQKAEDLSTIGVWLNRGTLVVVLLSCVLALFILDWVPTLVGAIIGCLLGVSAIVLGFASKAKSYNTELGSRQASKAIVFGFLLSFILGFVVFLIAISL